LLREQVAAKEFEQKLSESDLVPVPSDGPATVDETYVRQAERPRGESDVV